MVRLDNQINTGQAAISLVFLVGGAVVLVGVTLTFLVLTFINTTYGFRAANRALGVALAGANDVLWQLRYDRDFFGKSVVGCNYDVYVGSDKAEVSVVRGGDGSCGNLPQGRVEVISEATVLGRGRRVKMVVAVDEVTGAAEIASVSQEIFGSGGGAPCPGGCP